MFTGAEPERSGGDRQLSFISSGQLSEVTGKQGSARIQTKRKKKLITC